MFVYLVNVSENRIKFGLSKDQTNLKQRMSKYRTIVPDAYFIKVWEVVDAAYVEDCFKKRFDSLRVINANGRKSEVIQLDDPKHRDNLIEMLDSLVTRANQGF